MRDPQEPAARMPELRPDPRDELALAAMNRALSAAAGPVHPAVPDAARLFAVFVVGAPRSGTTLLSQLLSRHLEVGYVDNVIARFWMRPSAGIALSRSLLGPDARSKITLESRHGSTSTPEGPHEFGYFWRRWLSLDSRTSHHPASDPHVATDVAGLGRALREELLGQFGLPTIFKNPICGLHAPTIAAAHPRSMFIHIVRDRTATCASILRSRVERVGSHSSWWSLKPSGFNRIAAIGDSARQVVAQVDACRAEIDEAIAASGAASLKVGYEAVCSDPAAALTTIAERIGAKTHGRLPETLQARPAPSLDPPLAAALARATAP